MNPFHIIRGQSQLECVWISFDQLMDNIDLFKDGFNSFRPRRLTGHVDRPELSADTAGAEPGNICSQGRFRKAINCAQIERVQIATALSKLPGEIIVAVDQGNFSEQFE